MKETKTVIKGLKIEVGGKIIELSIEDAEKLHNALGAIFDRQAITIDRPYPVPQPYPHNPYPWILQDVTTYKQDENITWYSDNAGTTTYLDCKIS